MSILDITTIFCLFCFLFFITNLISIDIGLLRFGIPMTERQVDILDRFVWMARISFILMLISVCILS